MKLLSPAESNTKTRKTQGRHPEYRIVSLALSPEAIAPGHKTNCPGATEGCIRACVGGRAVGMASVFPQIMDGRIRKTHYLRTDTAGFIRQLIGELQTEVSAAKAEGRTVAARLNTFSDLSWESETLGRIPQQFIGEPIVFYDYTAIPHRAMSPSLPENYHLCLSRKETPRSHQAALDALAQGVNVAVVFAQVGPYAGHAAYSQRLPKTWHGFHVYDGDDTDLRFLDPGPTRTGRGRICGLRLKSNRSEERQRAIETGFAVLVD